MKSAISIIVLLWTLVAVVLSLCGIGAFAEWPITAWPWHWSCLCILYWDIVLWSALIFLFVSIGFITAWRKEKVINSYAPEQRKFIRKMMNR